MERNIIVKRYDSGDFERWNNFVRKAKNPLFMFDRNYMDYHKERFRDHSLIFFSNYDIVAILPANEENEMLISHGGLTYGGLILNEKAKQHTVNECFEAIIEYLRKQRLNKMVYKAIPHLYHEQPCEEEKYALYYNNAKLVEVSASTVVNLKNPLKMSKGRKAQISRAKREGVEVQRLENKRDYDAFIALENEVLESRHNTRAVHSSEELFLLHTRFPENIHLYGAMLSTELIAGVVLYEYGQVIHTQYMAANETAKTVGALDLIIATIINKYEESKQWLDFGISTEKKGKYLNGGLIAQKEGFGGRTNVYEIWEINIGNQNGNKIL